MRIYYNGKPIDTTGLSIPVVSIGSDQYDILPEESKKAEILYIVDEKSIKYKGKTAIGFTIDDTLTLSEDNLLAVENPNKGILAQAEYDMLSPEEQKKGVYFVDDGNGLEVVESNVYSTEETTIGRWVDGKPIYRQVIFTSTGNSSGGTTIGTLEAPIDYITQIQGVINSNNSFVTPYSLYSHLWINRNNILFYTTNKDYTYKPITIIVEYTKTTDYPTI